MNKDNIKVSGCILTRNDSQLIKQCVEHIIPYVNEIIILDANDDNKTEDIIKSMINNPIGSCSNSCSKPPIIYKRSKESQNFAKDRNELQSMSSGDYVLHIDCDERFDERFLSISKYLINQYLNQKILPVLFRFPRINQPDRINYPDYQIRLLNRKYTKWIGNVHETVEIIGIENLDTMARKVINLITLDYPIIHLYKEKDMLQERWKGLLSQQSNLNKKLLAICIFRDIDVEKILQRVTELYVTNQSKDDNDPEKYEINFSFFDETNSKHTFETLERFTKEGYILNIQLRKVTRLTPMSKIDYIKDSVKGFPLRDDDYILFV